MNTLVKVFRILVYNSTTSSIDLILPAALGPGVYSASNRNKYQELIK
jgi:hypothetical protein